MTTRFFVCVAATLLFVVPASNAVGLDEEILDDRDGAVQEWSYEPDNGPAKWPEIFETCGGKRQSPIDLPLMSKKKYFRPFKFTGYNQIAMSGKIKNTGKGPKIEELVFAKPAQVSGGGFVGSYTFAQFHFHHGSSDTEGSEHEIDGVSFPLELHLVHYKTSYGSLGEAVKHPDGLAVLGIIYETGVMTPDNPKLQPLIDLFSSIPNAGDSASIPMNIPLMDYLPMDTSDFYRYEGSLTTPGCNEVVIWTVFKNKVGVSTAQLASFRSSLKNDRTPAGTLVENFRPPQPLNNRVVFSNDPNGGLCETLPVPLSQTVGRFELNLKGKGKCSNMEKVKGVMTCGQHCTSSQQIVSTKKNQFLRTKMDCCTATVFEKIPVTLTCKNGQKIMRMFENIKDCNCKEAKGPRTKVLNIQKN